MLYSLAGAGAVTSCIGRVGPRSQRRSPHAPLTFSFQAVIPISFYPKRGKRRGAASAAGILSERRSLRVRVFYHDKCFDGASSAALFSRFYRERIRGDAEFTFSGLVHRAGALFDESHFDGDENAIVDFKYSSSPKITWWFDHHLSAFLSPADHENFLACLRDPSCANRKFFDPTYVSCTSYLAHIAATQFGFNTAPVADL